ncbi:MAG: monovalent cation/H+ antiporter subunit D family protein [Pseudomonadota bacterium]
MLIVILPLIAAPLCIIARHSFAAFLIALTANSISVLLAVAVVRRVIDGSVIHYSLGGWIAPTGIEYYIDTLNGVLLLIISLLSFLALIFAKDSIQQEISKARHYLFYAGWLMCLVGLLGMVITGDAFNVFVFLEISSLSMYMLIALGKQRRQAILAAFRYLMMGSIGASFILLGIGFLYAATGTLNMLDLSERLPGVGQSRTVLVGFSFITVGLLIKTAVFPVHSWLANTYQFAPSSIAVFLAGTATKVSLYVFLRFFFHVFGQDYSFAQMLLDNILLPLVVIGFFVMSIVAVYQTDIRRVLAYSSIAQIGYIFVALIMATESGLTAGIIHMINHAFIKAALFVAAGCIAYRLGSTRIKDMSGLVVHMPWTTSAFIIAGLSLIGIPLTAGFISKWHLIAATIESGWWLIALMILLSSLIAIVYIGKIIEVFCFGSQPNSQGRAVIQEAPLSMLLPLWILIIISLYTGINADVVVSLAAQSADQLLGTMQ